MEGVDLMREIGKIKGTINQGGALLGSHTDSKEVTTTPQMGPVASQPVRIMLCGATYGKPETGHGAKPSDPSAFTFQDLAASRNCAVCGYVPGCHGQMLSDQDQYANLITTERWAKLGYEPHEWVKRDDPGYDIYYCGCKGWD
jgi:hypothetical protein